VGHEFTESPGRYFFESEEFIRIQDAYKKQLLVDSRRLLEFSKAMLAMGAVSQQGEDQSQAAGV